MSIQVWTPEKVKAFRLTQHWTQEELAHRVGVCVAQISRWEHGKSLPSKASGRRLVSLVEEIAHART